MKKLKIGKESRNVYDIEHITKSVILLKGIGRYCQAQGCGKHLFGRFNQKFCSNKCKWKTNALKNPPRDKGVVHFNINLTTHGINNKYRTARVYLKKGIVEELKITPDAVELWKLLDRIENFRKIPMGILN